MKVKTRIKAGKVKPATSSCDRKCLNQCKKLDSGPARTACAEACCPANDW